MARSQGRHRGLRARGVGEWLVMMIGARGRSGVTLFPPRIAVVVVASALPVAGLIPLAEANAREPLGAFPEVQVRNDAAHRRAVREPQGSAVEFEGDQRVRG